MERQAWAAVKEYAEASRSQHLRDLLKNDARNEALIKEFDGIYLDLSRQNAQDANVLTHLNTLAQESGVYEKVAAMFNKEVINGTEKRAVYHVGLRKPDVPEVQAVNAKIAEFSNKIRAADDGAFRGVTDLPMKNYLAIGIGGSSLGPLAAHECLKSEPTAKAQSSGRNLIFISNVDPTAFSRAVDGLKAEETLVVIVSKTFTTAETMMNARKAVQWLTESLQGHDQKTVVAKHVCAVSTALNLTSEFGLVNERVFEFWDWVGGRYSISSAVGLVPLSLQYGFDVCQQFLNGAHSMDQHFLENATPDKMANNLPLLLGLFGAYNVTALDLPNRAILPYFQGLHRFAAHLQQLDMESNGKGVSMEGQSLKYGAGPFVFGEPGTDGQHSFYQLLHQGRVAACEFIGVCKNHVIDQPQHDEFMSNFFAQPDALAMGKTVEEVKAQNVPEELQTHKAFDGNRPSLSILFPEMTAHRLGQLYSLYENRVVVEGFVWGINSFDQWGVQLGKDLAKNAKALLTGGSGNVNSATTKLVQVYLSKI